MELAGNCAEGNARSHDCRHNALGGGAALLVLLAFLGFTVSAAYAAPEWGLTVEHHNPYGAESAECPGGHESAPGEPLCGVDPFTRSGTTFTKESGFNEYKVTVTNMGDEPAGAEDASVGQTVTCDPGTWSNGPASFSYQWLRSGEPIAGATSPSYTMQALDAGKAVQCRMAASNGGASVLAIASSQDLAQATPIVVTPAPASLPPTPPEGGIEAVSGLAAEAGDKLECNAGQWGNEPTAYTYVWFRNGVQIAETVDSAATSSTYTLRPEDVATAATFQCQVTASNAAGAVASLNQGLSATTYAPAPEPSSAPPVVGAFRETRPLTSPSFSVVDSLPPGLALAGTAEQEVTGDGWICNPTDARNITCTREEATAIAPGSSYEPITLRVHVNSEATNPSTDIAVASGGGAASVVTQDPTTVVAAPPFGVESFTTTVADESGDPFSQAAGHPFSATASLVFNFESDDEGNLRTAGGTPKEVQTELPPGFIGNPQARPRCPILMWEKGQGETPCPSETMVGFIRFSYDSGRIEAGQAKPLRSVIDPIYNLEPANGVPATFGFIGSKSYARFTLNAAVRSDGDYGVTIGSLYTPTPTLLSAAVTFCDDEASYTEIFGTVSSAQCDPPGDPATPAPAFLTNPALCGNAAPTTTLLASSYQQPAEFASIISYAGAPSAAPAVQGGLPTYATPNPTASFVAGCDDPELASSFDASSLAVSTETAQTDMPTGVGFDLTVPQTNDVTKLATPELRSAAITLPEGMTLNPSAADGLLACTDAQFGLDATYEPAEPSNCPAASEIGTVVVKTALLERPLNGQVFVGEPECSPCSATDAEQARVFRLFVQAYSPERGVIVKLLGKVSANPATGRLQATFKEQPQLPFEDLTLRLRGGAQAPLATPQTCGEAKTTSDLTPWSSEPGVNETAGTPDAKPSSTYAVNWDGAGGACPTSIPFSPTFLAQAASPAAGTFEPLSVSFGRPSVAQATEERDEQNFAGITVRTPPGLLGKVASVAQCAEAEANSGDCPQTSAIGTATVGAGTGSRPLYLGGTVYLTGPYRGAPFGLSIVVPAKAGPFNLGTVVVRASISVNPTTAALTIKSDPLPEIVDGVPLRLHSVRVDVTRPGFTLNPTSCAQQQITASLAGEHVNVTESGKTITVSSPFAASGCSNLPFRPALSATAPGVATFNGRGAGIDVTVTQAPGEADIARVDVQLPKALPARLATLKESCTEGQFGQNPAGCPAASDVGTATAETPLLNSPLTGPAYLVSHGGAALPHLQLVLQGEGITLILDGTTEIKNGITFEHFDTVPDAPVSTFDLSLPEQANSVLASQESAHGSLCGHTLVMPTTITGQNGAQVKQNTKIVLTGCVATKRKPKALTREQKLTRALRACQKDKSRRKRSACERQARHRYGPLHKATKARTTKKTTHNAKAGR